MAIPLGRSIGEPSYVFAQNINVVSLFYLIMGGVAVIIVIVDVILTNGMTSGAHIGLGEKLGSCLHVPLSSLFQPFEQSSGSKGAPTHTSDTAASVCGSLVSHSHFILLHFFSSILFAYPLARSIQRRKFALDFVISVYVIYFVLSAVAQKGFPGNWIWWCGSLIGSGSLYVGTLKICEMRELQDIRLTGAPPAPYRVPPAESANSSPREMVEVGTMGAMSGGTGSTAAVPIPSPVGNPLNFRPTLLSQRSVSSGSRAQQASPIQTSSGVPAAAPEPVARPFLSLDEDIATERHQLLTGDGVAAVNGAISLSVSPEAQSPYSNVDMGPGSASKRKAWKFF